MGPRVWVSESGWTLRVCWCCCPCFLDTVLHLGTRVRVVDGGRLTMAVVAEGLADERSFRGEGFMSRGIGKGAAPGFKYDLIFASSCIKRQQRKG